MSMQVAAPEIRDCYAVSRKQFEERCPFPLQIVPDTSVVNKVAARKVVDLLTENNRAGRETSLIFPVGPLQYEPLADLCNRERVDLRRLSIYMMDEYLQPDGRMPVAPTHPLSFKRFMTAGFTGRLDPGLGFADDRLVIPMPHNLEAVSRRILGMGGVDLCFAGIGISGHLAFNDPPEPHEKEKGLDWVRNCATRIVTISRESCTQMACGGTHGNWAIIPKLACTLGMKELLASKRICLIGMRAWHAGTVRRALFGPVSADCPGSLLQEHPNVEVLMTELAAKPPMVNVTLDTGEE